MTVKRPAWHGWPALKAEALHRMRDHRSARGFVQGMGNLDGFHGRLSSARLAEDRGISVPAFACDSDHGREIHWYAESERLWAIPYAIGRTLDLCFATVPATRAGDFAVEATQAIPVGADLSLALAAFTLDLLADEEGSGEHGVLRHLRAGSQERAAVERVVTLYRRRLAGDEPAEKEWSDTSDDLYRVSCTLTPGQTNAAHAAVYAAFAAAASHAALYHDTAHAHTGWVEAETPDAAAYATFVGIAAPDAVVDDIVRNIGDAVGVYGDPPYAYSNRPYAFVDETACEGYYRWRAERLLHHLNESGDGSPRP